MVSPSPFENMRASTASHAENKCSTYTRYASALFSAVSLYLLRLFSKGFVFPLPIVSGKTSGKVFLFNKQFSLADCCILFTITIKKTKCSTALSAPIFLPLLFCSRGVFPLNRFKNRTCITRAAKRISASIAVRNTTVPSSVYSSHTAVTRSVGSKDESLLLRIQYTHLLLIYYHFNHSNHLLFTLSRFILIFYIVSNNISIT